MMADEEPYRLADDPPPKRRYRPMPGVAASAPQPPSDEPVLKRFIGHDPFPWVLGLCVLAWVGLGLGSRHYQPLAWALIVAGVVACVLAEVWLYISIWEEDRTHGVLSIFSNWYRAIYLRVNPEIGFRPNVLAAVGILMCLTGMGLTLAR